MSRLVRPRTPGPTAAPRSQPMRGGGASPLPGPARQPNRRVALVVTLLCLAAVLPALLINLSQPDVTRPAEARALLTSLHTWQHQQGPGAEQLSFYEKWTPHLHRQSQLQQPPATTWLQVAAARAGDGDELSGTGASDPVERLIWRGRLLSVGFVLLTIACISWAAYGIGGPTTAGFAALVAASNLLLVYFGRIATPGAAHAAWVSLSIAAAIWAVRPLRPAPSLLRQAGGWALAGVALAIAVLTAGPRALLDVGLPLVLILAICPDRLSHVLGLLAAAILAALTVLPWAVYVYQRDPAALTDLSGLADTHWSVVAGGWRLLALGVGLLPWTVWLAAAVIQPVSTSSLGVRRRLFLGWGWFASALALWAVAPQETGALLAALAAAAVLIGQLFRQFSDLAAEGRFPRVWRWLRWPHLAMLLLGSVALPLLLWAQPALVSEGWLATPVAAGTGWWYGAALTIALLVMAMAGFYWAVRDYPGRALVWWALWALVMISFLVVPVSQGPLARSEIRDEAAKLAHWVDDERVLWLQGPDGAQPNAALLLYSKLSAPPVSIEHLQNPELRREPVVLLSGNRQWPGLAQWRVTWLQPLREAQVQVRRLEADPPPSDQDPPGAAEGEQMRGGR